MKLIIGEFLVLSDQSLRDALRIIDANGRRVCFVVDAEGILLGSVSDGDVRRGLLKGLELDSELVSVMNPDPVFISATTAFTSGQYFSNQAVEVVPVCDEQKKIVSLENNLTYNRIPFLDPELGSKELENVQACIESNWISSQGSFVKQFEEKFSDLHAECASLAVCNGTAALHLALESFGIGMGDEVIVPNLTFAACANSVIYTGATPVFCDVDDTFCIDTDQCLSLITDRTRAIMVVHLYGKVADVERLASECTARDIILIEDCAEALGSSIQGKRVGTFGDAATFSFFGNKTITTGEGGMVVFKNPEIAEKAKILRDHGMSPNKRYWHSVVGYNYRLTNLQAAVGLAQIEKLDQIIQKKRALMSLYNERLNGSSKITYLPHSKETEVHSNWLYAIRFSPEVSVQEVTVLLAKSGIETRPVFYPLSTMPAYLQYAGAQGLENSLRLHESGFCLPTSLRLNEKHVDIICSELSQVLERY